jgi:hypothetical protein
MHTDATLTAEEPQSTSSNFGPGYRLDAKGRPWPTDDPFLASSALYIRRRSAAVVGRCSEFTRRRRSR